MNKFGDKAYNTLDYYYKNRFGSKVFKVSLDGGFTCPNIDGTVGRGGCIYCSDLGSGEFAGERFDSLEVQFEKILSKMLNKWDGDKYIGYFQAHTNTYADVSVLKDMYERVLKIDGVIGLSIATRPDSISDDVLEYLALLNKRTYLTIELGLQTIHETTSDFINRCHSLEQFDLMVAKLRKHNIDVVVHIINGLPYETKDMMLETINHLNKLDIQGVKIHMLHIIKRTKLAYLYKKEPFDLLTITEYVNIICDQIENLRNDIIIHRVTGDAFSEDLIAPLWTLKKFVVMNEIDKEFKRRGTYQGFNSSILNRVRLIMDKTVKNKDIVIDATTGNGHDSLYLSKKITDGFLYGFDIQEEAINNTRILLNSENIKNYELFLIGHENILDKLSFLVGKVSLITFNLGYLPGANKEIVTNYKNTIKAIRSSLSLLNNKGVILITVYSGHDDGLEASKLEDYISNISHDFIVNKYNNTDNITAPYLIEIKNDSN